LFFKDIPFAKERLKEENTRPGLAEWSAKRANSRQGVDRFNWNQNRNGPQQQWNRNVDINDYSSYYNDVDPYKTSLIPNHDNYYNFNDQAEQLPLTLSQRREMRREMLLNRQINDYGQLEPPFRESSLAKNRNNVITQRPFNKIKSRQNKNGIQVANPLQYGRF
jgi:hypothetical protein